VGVSQLLLVSIAIIVLTFAALEWREARGLERARARYRRRKGTVAGPSAHSCGNPAPEICDSPQAAPRQPEQDREMSNTIRARLGVIVVAGFFVTALAALSGCATLRGQDAVSGSWEVPDEGRVDSGSPRFLPSAVRKSRRDGDRRM
jgi:hypothetical protein